MTRFTDWLTHKWRRHPSPDLVQAYQVTFSSVSGRMVLQDWLDEIYCQPCHSNDPMDLCAQNAQRKFVHRILEVLDQGNEPGKYETQPPHEEPSWQMSRTEI